MHACQFFDSRRFALHMNYTVIFAYVKLILKILRFHFGCTMHVFQVEKLYRFCGRLKVPSVGTSKLEAITYKDAALNGFLQSVWLTMFLCENTLDVSTADGQGKQQQSKLLFPWNSFNQLNMWTNTYTQDVRVFNEKCVNVVSTYNSNISTKNVTSGWKNIQVTLWEKKLKSGYNK